MSNLLILIISIGIFAAIWWVLFGEKQYKKIIGK